MELIECYFSDLAQAIRAFYEDSCGESRDQCAKLLTILSLEEQEARASVLAEFVRDPHASHPELFERALARRFLHVVRVDHGNLTQHLVILAVDFFMTPEECGYLK
jgi:hypothetical protein